MSAGNIIVVTRTEVFSVLILMTLPPFMAVAMDGAVDVVTDLTMFSVFFWY